MKKQPKISIITVSLNEKKGIERTIKSVLDQTYENIEYVVIDGGSTDRTVDVIKQYQNNIDYWISESDEGIYQGMNKGVKHSTGNYLYFLNASDQLHNKNVVRKVVSNLSRKKVDLLYGKVVHKYSDYKVVKAHQFARKNLQQGKIPPHQASFIAKGVFNKIGNYNESYLSAGDLDFYCRMQRADCTSNFLNRKIAEMPSGGMSSQKKISLPEAYEVIKRHYGLYHALRFALRKIVFEQGFKKILLIIGLKSMYKKLAKKHNQKTAI